MIDSQRYSLQFLSDLFKENPELQASCKFKFQCITFTIVFWREKSCALRRLYSVNILKIYCFKKRFIQYFSTLPLRLDRTFLDDKWDSYFRIYISVKPYTHFPVNNIHILSGFRIYFRTNIWTFVVKKATGIQSE